MNEHVAAREALHRVTVHIVARARVQAAGRFSLRVTPGGLGTPDIGTDGRRVRIAAGNLIVESDAPGAAAARSTAIHGASLASLAAFAGVDLAVPLDVGHDTPPVGDIDTPIALDAGEAAALGDLFGQFGRILDGVLGELPAGAVATLPRLWPEHFDLAAEAQATPERRVNLGGSPGDGYLQAPYLYVGPWTADRPGSPEFWNAPFGAAVAMSDLGADAATQTEAGIAFLLDGYGRLV